MAEHAVLHVVTAAEYNAETFTVGDIKPTARRTAPTSWAICDGTAISRTTYADAFAALVPDLGTVTVTIATPGVFTLAAHGLVVGDRVYLTTTGALPTGLAANTIYYVVSTPTADTFTVSASGASGSPIDTTGSQSGTHTLRLCPYGLGDGSTTFNVPDFRARSLVGASGSGGALEVRALGQNDNVAVANRRPHHRHTPHAHTIAYQVAAFSGGGTGALQSGSTTSTSSVDGGSGVATDSLDAPAYATVNWLVKIA